jgi:hypothetical protein
MTTSRLARSLAVASVALCMTAGMILGSRGASATSILIDNGATTYDSSTQLSWLDLTATVGKSYDVITGGFGGYFADGWRYASSGELVQLFIDAGGVGPFDGSYTVQNHAAASNLLSLLGVLHTSFPLGTSKGLLSDSGSFPGSHTFGSISLWVFTGGALTTSSGAFANDYSFSDTGSFLVRAGPPVATTPIPATLPLLAAALGGLGFIGWRKKAAATASER